MLYILRVTDDDGWWQRGDTDLESGEIGLMIGSHEPIQELMSRLKEPESIAGERQGARRTSEIGNSMLLLWQCRGGIYSR